VPSSFTGRPLRKKPRAASKRMSRIPKLVQ